MVLARGPIGDEVAVEVLRDGVLTTASLTAQPDGTDVAATFGISPPEKRVASHRLPQGPGYIAVGWEATYATEFEFQRALASHRDAPCLVVDLRGNDGGMERTAANVAGFFATERMFYETVTFLNNRTLQQEVMSEVWVEPQEIYWDRPTAVLVDGVTVSSGEGLAMLLSRMPQVEVFGFEETAASFGSTGSSIALPHGWVLDFPGGRSLDARGDIQLDSDDTLEGGVHPTVRIPWTPQTRIAHASGDDPVLATAVAWLVGEAP